jgi:hypothetical protein
MEEILKEMIEAARPFITTPNMVGKTVKEVRRNFLNNSIVIYFTDNTYFSVYAHKDSITGLDAALVEHAHTSEATVTRF